MLHKFILVIAIALTASVALPAQDFRVQAAAFFEPVPKSYFEDRGVFNAVLNTDQMGMNRYFVGSFHTREEAEKVQQQLVEKGFPFATIVDLQVQRLLCGDNCPYFKGDGAIFMQPDRKTQQNSVYFDAGKISLNDEAKTLLNRIAEEMKANASARLNILGHSDGNGDAQANLELSATRSRVVRNYLIGKGVKADRMYIKVFGESRPVAPNTDPFTGKELKENQAWNRRVELMMVDEGMATPLADMK